MPSAQDHVGLNVINLQQAKYQCVYPTCGGVCCKHPRPAVEPDEQQRIEDHLHRILPLLRPEARDFLERRGMTTLRKKDGLPTLAVVDHWCIFNNDGCTLHRLGAEEGDAFKYKPWRCSAFPLDRDAEGNWYVRQWGVNEEAWDLFCLNPNESPLSAAETLAAEMEFIKRVDEKYPAPH